MKKQLTAEEKKVWFEKLRKQWRKAKELSEAPEYENAYLVMMAQAPNCIISQTGFTMALMQMKEQGLEGLPYVDCKTFNGWRKAGFKVRRGEHSTVKGITWVSAGGSSDDPDESNSDSFVFPKVYNLFHKTQVTDL